MFRGQYAVGRRIGARHLAAEASRFELSAAVAIGQSHLLNIPPSFAIQPTENVTCSQPTKRAPHHLCNRYVRRPAEIRADDPQRAGLALQLRRPGGRALLIFEPLESVEPRVDSPGLFLVVCIRARSRVSSFSCSAG